MREGAVVVDVGINQIEDASRKSGFTPPQYLSHSHPL